MSTIRSAMKVKGLYVIRVRWLCNHRNDGSVLHGRVALDFRTGGSNSPGVFNLTKRKYLYVMYSGTFIPVLIDAIKLSVDNKDVRFMSHFYWNEYVFFKIIIYVFTQDARIASRRYEELWKINII